MTALCGVCREVIFGAPVAAVGEARTAAEFAALCESLRAHLVGRHKDALQAAAGLVELLVLYTCSLYADEGTASAEFKSARATAKDFLLAQIDGCRVEIQLRDSSAPLVV